MMAQAHNTFRFVRTLSCGLLAACLVGVLPAPAQEELLTLDEMIDEGEQWMRENIDPEVLRLLGEVDREQVKAFIGAFQGWRAGDTVADTGSLAQEAAVALPLLEAREETRPYASWLKNQQDYLDVASQFKPAPPLTPIGSGSATRPIPNPAPDVERAAWKAKLAKRPLPKGAEDYVLRLKPIFAAQNVPQALVWVAEVESSFEPAARSPTGAAGLFQLTPGTAKRHGLSAWPRDERFQPEKNTAAAARHLKALHGEFKDWRLVLAAYNAGEGCVRRLLRRHKGGTFDAIATHLPAETQMYVPRVEATLLLREGVSLAELPAPDA